MSGALEKIISETESALEEARSEVSTLEEVLRLLRDGKLQPEERLRQPSVARGSKSGAGDSVARSGLVEWIEKHIRSKPSGKSRKDYMLKGAHEAVHPDVTESEIDAALKDNRFVVEDRGWTHMKGA